MSWLREIVGYGKGSFDQDTGAMLVVASRPRLLACKAVTVVASASIASIQATALDDNLAGLTLVPRTGKSVYWNVGGAASTATCLIPAGGISLACTKTIADTIRLYCADAGPNLDIIQLS